MSSLSSIITQVNRPNNNEEDLDDVVISVNTSQKPPNTERKVEEKTEQPDSESSWQKIFSCFPCCRKDRDEGGSAGNANVHPLNNGQRNNNNSNNAGGAANQAAQNSGSRALAAPRNDFVPLLAPALPIDRGKKTLVLDLDETLVHSSFRPVPNADFIIPVEIENEVHRVYVLKRPGVDHFMKEVGQRFEVVIFTASLAKYADPLLDLLDIHKVIRFRLFREACVISGGNYVKDLSLLGRELRHTIIVDNSPHSFAFQPRHAIAIDSWFDDKSDTQLFDLLDFLTTLIDCPDVSTILDASKGRQF